MSQIYLVNKIAEKIGEEEMALKILVERKHALKFIYFQQFLPYRRADLTASASLQRICGGQPQLHTLCFASAANSTRKSSRTSLIIHKKRVILALMKNFDFLFVICNIISVNSSKIRMIKTK